MLINIIVLIFLLFQVANAEILDIKPGSVLIEFNPGASFNQRIEPKKNTTGYNFGLNINSVRHRNIWLDFYLTFGILSFDYKDTGRLYNPLTAQKEEYQFSVEETFIETGTGITFKFVKNLNDFFKKKKKTVWKKIFLEANLSGGYIFIYKKDKYRYENIPSVISPPEKSTKWLPSFSSISPGINFMYILSRSILVNLGVKYRYIFFDEATEKDGYNNSIILFTGIKYILF